MFQRNALRCQWIGFSVPILMILIVLCVLHDAQAGSNAVPSLVGQWKIMRSAYATFTNILDVDSIPEFGTTWPPDTLIVITEQELNAFAGYVSIGDDKKLLTGAIANDRTVVFQVAGGTTRNNRVMFTSKYSVSGKKKLIKGTYFKYDEFAASKPSMENGVFEMQKQ